MVWFLDISLTPVCMCSAVTQLLQEGIVACAARCDVTKKTEVDRLVAYAVQQYGALDILVANAGAHPPSLLLHPCVIKR